MALEQFEVQWNVEAIAEWIGDGSVGCDCLIFVSRIDPNPRRVSVTRRINALVLIVFPLWGRFPEIVVAVVNVTVVDGYHLVARDFYSGLFYDGAA